MAEGALCYKFYCHSTKHVIQASDVTLIEDDGDQLIMNDNSITLDASMNRRFDKEKGQIRKQKVTKQRSKNVAPEVAPEVAPSFPGPVTHGE